MAWQAEVGSGSGRATNYHDLLTKIVAFATSQHVATVAVNSGGTGYTVGDVLTLTHAGAYLDARFEVTTVAAGVITGLRIVSSGAFSNRIASAVVGSSGGSGYVVGDVLELQDGSGRELGKVQVATLSGSAVATVTVFETGGAYGTAPGASSPTIGIGPAAFAGDDLCTITATMTGLIGTTGLSVTGGTGSSATVDITLAETGWAVDGRNTNSFSHNGVTNEKEVVLVGDATGRTNKPYIGLVTSTFTSGINTRYFIALIGLIAHNPALAITAQPNMLGDPGTWTDNRPYMLCDENAAQPMDFWITADDLRLGGVYNINPGAANTDDGEYLQWYAGFMDTFATEAENPYPYFIGASSRAESVDPSATSVSITSLAEAVAPLSNSTGLYFYRAEDSSWVSVYNSQNLNVSQQVNHGMAPMVRLYVPDSTSSAVAPFEITAFSTVLAFYTGLGSTGRASATKRLLPIPGTTELFFPIPLTVLSRPGGSSINQTLDTPRGQLRGFFWVYNTDAAGATITNFSEDYITIGTDRYRVFHNHKHTATYQFICIKEDV